MRPTIIVPLIGPELDPDGVAEHALAQALQLAEPTDAPIVLISVVEQPKPAVNLPDAPDTEPSDDESGVAARRAYLAQVAARHPDRISQTVVRVGSPAERILHLAGSLPDPMIVMVSRGRTGAARMLLGSVAFRVVHETRCPVVVVRVPEHGEAALARRPRRVLAPLDGSAAAVWALERALAMLGGTDLEVLLLHVIQPLDSLLTLAVYEYGRVTEDWATDHLQEIADRLTKRGYQAHAAIRTGRVATEIVRAAREEDIDLIAMATHGRGGLSRVVFGSVAERLVHEIAVPIMLLRPDPKEVAAAAEATDEPPATVVPEVTPIQPVTAGDIMTRPVIVVREETTLEEVARAMLKHKIGAVLVMDDQERLTGIVTESDFTGQDQGIPFSAYQAPQVFGMWVPQEGIERIYEAGRTLTAASVMSRPVTTVTEDAPIGAVIERMIRENRKRIPVVRDGKPVGIVSRHDLLKLMVRDTGQA